MNLKKFAPFTCFVSVLSAACGGGGDSTDSDPGPDPDPGPSETAPTGAAPTGSDVEEPVDPEPVDPEPVDQEPADVVMGTTAAGARCARETRIGSLSVMLGTDRTIVSGAVSDGVLPSSIPAVSGEAEGCQLLTPRDLFCSACSSDQTCAGDDECVAKPAKVSAGALEVSGLLTAVDVSPNGITLDYSKTLLEPFPAYEVGSALVFQTEGADVPAFKAEVTGLPKLSSEQSVVSVGRERPAVLTWDATGVDTEASAIYVSFSVNVHGAVTGWIECTVDDDGEFEIPEPLITQLIDMGLSGFPRVDLERRSSATVELATADLADGCVDVYAGSKLTLDIEVEGLTSCNTDEDCADGQSCSEGLACE